MNKRTKQVITGVLFVSFAFFASQISNNGGLKSSIFNEGVVNIGERSVKNFQALLSSITTEEGKNNKK